MSSQTVITVSQLNRYIGLKIKNDLKLRNLLIKGEISNFVNHKKTGHFFFTLKDDTSAIKVIMFSSYASNIKFTPENGLAVIVRGSIQAFERDGIYQIYAEEIQPDGIGALYLAYEQLKEKLEAKGLFDPAHKRPIPYMPRKICLITAKTGAAVQDMLNIIGRRFPVTEVVIIPTLVQGANAPVSICSSIALAQSTNASVILLGRGGGSIEDLWAFNDEKVAHAIYNSKIPIISAVGHETDFTIADFVADLRAPTPSAAAELAVPDMLILQKDISKSEEMMYNYTIGIYSVKKTAILSTYSRLNALSPKGSIRLQREKLQGYVVKLTLSMEKATKERENALKKHIGVIEALSPLSVLSRGYSITYKGDAIIKSVSELTKGEKITVKLGDGTVDASVL